MEDKKINIFWILPLLTICLLLILTIGCGEDKDGLAPSFYLSLSVNPEEGGTVNGDGQYQENEEAEISAIAEEKYEFANWTGNINYIDDTCSAKTYVTMPAYDITLTANFREYAPGDGMPGDGVTDINGNEYATVWIGGKEWMAENLRTTKYDNGTTISTGLNDEEWSNTVENNEGAYSIYPHEEIEGLGCDDEVVEAYGKLYNWYAVDDKRGICPEGWRVISDDDWTELIDHLMYEYDLHNSWESPDVEGVGNALKSCRQVNSPLGGNCKTKEHPRWNQHDIHYGLNYFGFSAFGGGWRGADGTYNDIGHRGRFWSSTEYSDTFAQSKRIGKSSPSVVHFNVSKETGFSVRCVRDL